MAENRDQTRPRSGGPSLKLYESVLPGGRVRVQGVVTNPSQTPPTYIIFSFQGVEHRESIGASGSAIFDLPDVAPGKYKVHGIVPEAGNLFAEIEATVPARREALVGDKLIVNSDGKDGYHTVYISVNTQDKKPVPWIHIVIKGSSGKMVAEGITNERGVIDPHPVITPRAPGVNHYNVYAEGTAIPPERLRLDGPPRYPKPPPPPEEIPLEDQEYVGRNLFWAMVAGWKAGRKARQQQKEDARGSQEPKAPQEELL